MIIDRITNDFSPKSTRLNGEIFIFKKSTYTSSDRRVDEVGVRVREKYDSLTLKIVDQCVTIEQSEHEFLLLYTSTMMNHRYV
jgi:hypothetical protein